MKQRDLFGKGNGSAEEGEEPAKAPPAKKSTRGKHHAKPDGDESGELFAAPQHQPADKGEAAPEREHAIEFTGDEEKTAPVDDFDDSDRDDRDTPAEGDDADRGPDSGNDEDELEDSEEEGEDSDPWWTKGASGGSGGFSGLTTGMGKAPAPAPAKVPRPKAAAGAPRRSIFAGAVMGAAIGDAMGHPTEFMSMAAIRSKYGPQGVTGFELYWDRGGKHFAPYTDDTQMAEIVLRVLVDAKENGSHMDRVMEEMASGFVSWSKRPQGGHRAPGNACMSGCSALSRGVHWSKAGGATAGGCGSVMRAYPFGLLFADDLQRAERWSVEHSKMTHRDPIALAACAAMAVGMARIVRGESVMTVASEMVAAACRYSPPTAAMMVRAIEDAVDGVAPEITLDRLRSWAAHEAVSAGVYLFVRNPDDPARAILEGANTPGDSDSIATLAGALCGARCGLETLPAAWVQDVERSEELLGLAYQAAGL